MENEQLELWKNLNKDNTIIQVQEYIRNVIELRGFSEQYRKNNVVVNRRDWRIS